MVAPDSPEFSEKELTQTISAMLFKSSPQTKRDLVNTLLNRTQYLKVEQNHIMIAL